MSDLSARLDGLSRKERAALLELVRRKKGETAAVAPVVVEEPVAARSSWEEGGEAPASFAQERLWLLDQLAPGSPAYNIPGAIRLSGVLDVEALVRVFTEIERRHAALRTVFTAQAGRPAQRILPVRVRPLAEIDLSALVEGVREAESQRIAAVEATRPFDLERGPLFRTLLVVLAPGEHLALFTMHHIVSDGWSMGVFYREVAALYEAFAGGRLSPLPEPAVQVPDVAIRQRSPAGEARLTRELTWWRQRLTGVATLELPTDRPRPPVRRGRGLECAVTWPAERVAALAALARGGQGTLYMGLLAAFKTLLHRLSGQDDIAVGSPVANRTDRTVESLIGFFVNTVVMRTGVSGDPPFRELLTRLRQTTLDALLRQEVPFEKVVEAVQPERQLARSPLFQVMFALQNTPREKVELPGLALARVAVPTETAKFDLSLGCNEMPEGLAVRFEFDRDLFEPATVERWLRHLETLVEGALATPDARLSALPLLAPEELAQLVRHGRGAESPFPRATSIHRLFEARADQQPEAVAISADGRDDWTYADLDAEANRLAHRLRRLGAGPEVPVLVVVERSPELIVAVLAVLKSGGFFVPFDPAHPRERLGVIAARVGARLAVTRERSLGLLPEGIAAVCVDRDRESLAGEPDVRLEGGAVGENLMYVLFTSGSTGEPKGVAVRHGNVCHLLYGNDFSRIGPGETYVILTAVTFDPSILEIWGTLVHGGRLAVLPPQLPSLDELADFLDRHGVTQMHLTTALFHQMAERRPDRLARLHRLAVGGEALSPALAGKALEAAPGLLVTNCYGPTEITVICSTHDVTPEDAHRPAMPIGRPVAHTALHVLGRHMEPVPVGVWGELYIGGEGVSRGYFGRPDLTAERYVPSPVEDRTDRSDRSDPTDRFDLQGGARLYRSGDSVRWRLDGVLEFAGRIDRQVKIRGYRIEPGEIEAAITAHPAVAEAAVLVRGDGGQRWLVAFVASAAADVAADLRGWLAGRLPDPMIPSDFVVLPALPLTPNGKVDRRALAQLADRAASGPAAGEGFVEPRTPAERTLAGLWIEVLGAERTGGRVGARDHFFELGGHSLLATRLIAAIRDVFGVDLPLHVLFERPTLEEIARELETLTPGPSPASGRGENGEEEGPAPLSFAQERLWLLDQIAPGTAAYNVPGAFRLHGALDVAALGRAVAEIVRRHDALRTTFAVEEGGPVQRIAPFAPGLPAARLPLIDLSALPEPARSATVRALARAEAVRPFDLAAGPLFRVTLLRVRLGAPQEHAAFYTMHHVVSDGWSMGVFFREVGALYAAFAAGRPSPLPPLPLQYAGFARRQRRRLAGPRLEQGLAAWRRLLEGVVPLELPADRPRPAVRSWRGGSVPVAFGADRSAALVALAREERATPYMAVLALLQALLSRLSGQDDVAVGTAVANRTDRDAEGLIGFFVNSLVMRTGLAGDPPFREIVRRARRAALESFQLQEIPFEKVVEAVQPERHASRTPLFQVMLTLQNTPRTSEPLAGLALEPVEAPRETAKFDLTLVFGETRTGLAGAVEFDCDLFDPATVIRWMDHLRTLAEAAVAAPERRLSELALLTDAEREEIVGAWNQTAVAIPRELPVHRLFEEQVDRAPDAVAVASEGATWTYAYLDATANRLAHRLRRLGAGPEVPVAVLAERSPELIAALLGVMKSGAFFVPVDPALPRERLTAVLGLSGARLAVTQECFRDLLPAGIEPVPLDGEGPDDRLAGGATAGNLVYAMFTSGSTGEPKGVAVTHGNVVRLVRGTDFGDLGPAATFLMLAPVSFDASTLELWGPLTHGGRVAVFPPHPPSLDELAAFLPRHGVNRLWLTAGLFHQMADERPEAFAGLARLLAGGDVVAPESVRRVLAAHPGLVLVNGYGPTESTTFATCQALTAPGEVGASVPIGRPIANTTVHVLEPGLAPAPLGVWGELWIGGEGLARGYPGRPDLTAERFLPDPFGDPPDRTDRTDPSDQPGPGARLYRTGDRARRRPDGVLEILGRLDRQVKIRGFRIEPGEVEAALAGHPAVAGAAVLVRGEGIDKRLVAYVAGEGDGAELRRWLAARLPEPMVPAAVVVLERLPLTPNGKVDRRALAQIAPERAVGEAGGFVAPRTPAEAALAGLFAEILGTERTGGRVGAQDDFFDLGGHSLLATQVVSRVRALFGVELPVRAVFEAPVLADLAARIERLRGGAPVEETPLVPVPREGLDASGLPLSFAQQRLWFLDRLQPGSPGYNIPSFFRLVGRLDPGVLERVVGELVRRHESLRTTFEERGGTPFQRIHPAAPVPLPRVDLQGLPEALRAGEARRLAGEETLRGFDLERGPLLRATLLRLGGEEHVFLSTMHHIVSDGWSTGVLAREVSALYDAFRQGLAAPLPDLPVQYADFAVWQRGRLAGEALEGELAFWRSRLADLPAVLDLPTDRPRPAVQGYRGALTPLLLRPGLSAALAALGRREGTTPFMTLLAAFQVLLGRAAGQERFGVGTPIAGRNRLEIEPLIGFFVNTLVLRADLTGAPAFREVLRRVRDEALDAHAHQELPFEKLVEDLEIERSLRHTPLFQTLFAFQNTPAARLTLPGLTLLPVASEGQVAKFDLSLNMAGDESGLGGSFDYSTDLFDATTLRRFARHFEILLEALAADPERGVWDVPLLEEAESHQVRVEWNDTQAPQGTHVPVLVEARAARRPEHPAVVGEAESLTYAELLHRARGLAARFRPGALVALTAERTPELIVQMLAVWQAGAAYVPVDPAWPRERQEYMLVDSGAVRGKDSKDFKDNKDLEEAGSLAFPQAPAYVIYTSGSTGRPKGVVVPHRALASFVGAAVETYGLTPDDRVLQFASISFDTSAEEIWPALASGATLVLRPEEMASSIPHFLREVERLRLTVLDLPTAFWHEMVVGMEAGDLALPGSVRLVILGGEEALADRLALWLRRVGSGVRLVNTYGPTETTIVATRRELSQLAPGEMVPIGRPIPGVRTWVLDPSFAPVPPGGRGELWIGGAGVAQGYLGRPDLTAERFVPDPFVDRTDRSDRTDPSDLYGSRLYRTGDLAVLRPDGDLVFAGRADRQVKIRGYRIEPGEIEEVLRRHPAVRDAVVVVREEMGDRGLVAFLVTAGEGEPRWREWAASQLPGFMVPAAFVTLDSLPLTPGGKVDRRALSRITPERGAGDRYVAPRTPAEETLAALFVEILGTVRTGGRVGVHDSFFALGGHSLLATRVVAAVRDAFRIDLPLRLLFERPTVEGLARAIEEAGGEGAAPVEAPIPALPRAPGENRFPVSFSQLREWILDRLEPGNPAYNIPSPLRIEGPLAVPVLLAALRGLVQRHEVFRTAFVAGEEEPLQAVLSEVRLEVPVIDLSALPQEERESALRHHARVGAGTGFDLATAPLLRAWIVRLSPEDHALLLTVHHIVSDGWSTGILHQELAALYAGSPLPPLPLQYADYAAWQRLRLSGEVLERQAGFWRERLAGAPPLLELPADRPRPPVRSSRGGKVPFHLPRPLADGLAALARRQGATLFMVLLAGYQTLLARWSGQDDVVVGTYSGNRPRRELEGLIGFFINTLVLRTGLAGDPAFATLLGRVRDTTLGAYAHADVPFEKLLEILALPRDPSRTPLFQALLVLQNVPEIEADLSPGVRLTALPVESEKADFDLALWLGEGADGLAGVLKYSADLFDEATLLRFTGQLHTLLDAALAGPERNVWALPLISAAEQRHLLAAWTRGPAVPGGPALLHRLVEEQAARTPAAVALEAGGVRTTYAELVDQAVRRAQHLRDQGIGPGAIVALTAERTAELIVEMLAVLQAGAAYLPVDPAYPRERREHMVEDSGAVEVKAKDGKDFKDNKDREDAGAETAAYVIYTSGSTGLPKGVVVHHGAIASFVRGAIASYGLAPGDRVLQFASISFDTSAEEIWPALASGATLVLRPAEMAASIPHFLRELARLGITVLDLPTAFWHEWVAGMEAEELEPPAGLRLVILGGEEALADRFALWSRRVGSSVRLVNTYGPTEATVVATRRELAGLAPGGLVPIGRPISGARAYVLDRFFSPVPPGVRGELWIGGAGVARGYLGRPDLTAERFVPDPFGEPGARLYRTGDLAFWRLDGDLVFAGRADRQLKIRGYRIEPGEIEAVLRLHPAVRDAVADARRERLVAWIVSPEGTGAPGALELRAFLRDRLPEPLVPAAFVPLAALPLGPGGKVDRRALPEPDAARPADEAFAEPQSALERSIAEIYRDLLRISRIGLHDNFFDLGGHSLLIVRAHQKLKEALGREIPVLDLFRFPTVAGLARHLGGAETGTLQKVQGLAEQQRAAQQRQKAAMERLRRRR